MTCEHDITERETAVTADGMCPLCLRSDLELRNQTACDRLEALKRIEPEVERLRAALTEICAMTESAPDDGWMELDMDAVYSIAKRALDGRDAEIERPRIALDLDHLEDIICREIRDCGCPGDADGPDVERSMCRRIGLAILAKAGMPTPEQSERPTENKYQQAVDHVYGRKRST